MKPSVSLLTGSVPDHEPYLIGRMINNEIHPELDNRVEDSNLSSGHGPELT